MLEKAILNKTLHSVYALLLMYSIKICFCKRGENLLNFFPFGDINKNWKTLIVLEKQKLRAGLKIYYTSNWWLTINTLSPLMSRKEWISVFNREVK